MEVLCGCRRLLELNLDGAASSVLPDDRDDGVLAARRIFREDGVVHERDGHRDAVDREFYRSHIVGCDADEVARNACRAAPDRPVQPGTAVRRALGAYAYLTDEDEAGRSRGAPESVEVRVGAPEIGAELSNLRQRPLGIGVALRRDRVDEPDH